MLDEEKKMRSTSHKQLDQNVCVCVLFSLDEMPEKIELERCVRCTRAIVCVCVFVFALFQSQSLCV